MRAKQSAAAGVDEECPKCGRTTPHAVSLQIKTESTKAENAEFSREPYRVSQCQVCGDESAIRMNNA